MALSPKDVLEGWKLWGIPALIALLAPWQEALTGLQLISEYYQPGINKVASAIGALGAMFSFAFLNDQSRQKQRWWAIYTGAAWLLCLIVCLSLTFTLGVTLDPGPGNQELIDVVHWLAYVGMFGLSGSLILALLMAGAPRPPRLPEIRQPQETQAPAGKP